MKTQSPTLPAKLQAAKNASLQSLQRESSHPLYEQITDRLRQLIISSADAGQLPTEEALTQQYGVSRSTVRKAVQRLVDESILVRRQGKGMFVARPFPNIVHSIDHLAPFYESFKRAGEEVSSEITDFSWSDAPALPKELDGWKRPVLTYHRRYFSAGVPHAITRVSLPLQIGSKIARADIESTPIYDFLQKKLALRLTRAEFLVSCRQPSPEVSAALQISQSSFLIILDRITRDANNEAVETTSHFLRSDVYQLSVVLKDITPSPDSSHRVSHPGEHS